MECCIRITKEQAETSLYGALKEDFSVHIAKTTEHVEIALADERSSSHLNCEPWFTMLLY
ncbi:UTRA domain-containing protein [Virgibacillus salarius]|uniref:UTRA domain-containing protein n=1 Tax=Virgibacillus salarius TaxID=447199 RepID=UPI0031E959D9